jgi:hypothetical protein
VASDDLLPGDGAAVASDDVVGSLGAETAALHAESRLATSPTAAAVPTRRRATALA